MTADPARITTARQLLTQLGLTIADLHWQDTSDRAVPKLAEYLPQVIAAAGPGATRTYGSYWTKMAMAWGARTTFRWQPNQPGTRTQPHRPRRPPRRIPAHRPAPTYIKADLHAVATARSAMTGQPHPLAQT